MIESEGHRVHQIGVAEAAGQLDSLLEAALKGEEVVIVSTAGSVQLVPFERAHRRRRSFGSARGVFEIPDDFDVPSDDFDEHRS